MRDYLPSPALLICILVYSIIYVSVREIVWFFFFVVNYSVVNAVSLIVYETLGREGLRLRQGPIDPPSCCKLMHT